MPKYLSLERAIANLEVGDIVLFHTKGFWRSKTIRRMSGSYWNHVALVFDVPTVAGRRADVILIEALDKGIEIHRLSKYVRSRSEEFGFKRMRGMTEEERERFRGFFLDALDTPYDLKRVLSFLFRPTLRRLFGRVSERWVSRWFVDSNSYICSTFAQRSYFLASEPRYRLQRLFLGHRQDLNLFQKMEQVTPGKIAQSTNTLWLYNPHN